MKPESPILYHYWRSSCSWRVRWGMEIKNYTVEKIPLNLLNRENESAEHYARNPSGAVPTLHLKEGNLSESVAILEWLNETIPNPPLFPNDPFQRALCRQAVEIINAGTQPLQNLDPQAYYSEDPAKRKIWCQHWIREGLTAYESHIAQFRGRFSMGDSITMADLFLVPQVYNAIRFEVDLAPFGRVSKIYENALQEPTCQRSHPDRYQ